MTRRANLCIVHATSLRMVGTGPGQAMKEGILAEGLESKTELDSSEHQGTEKKHGHEERRKEPARGGRERVVRCRAKAREEVTPAMLHYTSRVTRHERGLPELPGH